MTEITGLIERAGDVIFKRAGHILSIDVLRAAFEAALTERRDP